jgi:hypothetical protein
VDTTHTKFIGNSSTTFDYEICRRRDSFPTRPRANNKTLKHYKHFLRQVKAKHQEPRDTWAMEHAWAGRLRNGTQNVGCKAWRERENSRENKTYIKG